MKLKVTFREYLLPEEDEETGEMHRGEYIGSFRKEFEGETPLAIMEAADKFATEYSEKEEVDCRVWEIPLNVTPQGISSL
ncbi:MAG: hypothetical protein VKL39_14095 [Leptolyngbyaceae bacterium]|nr:hypothetical protein [Leptolyngbyaceae bacterium]